MTVDRSVTMPIVNGGCVQFFDPRGTPVLNPPPGGGRNRGGCAVKLRRSWSELPGCRHREGAGEFRPVGMK